MVASSLRECSASSLDHGDLLALCKIRQHLSGEAGDEVENILRPLIVSYWEDHIEDDIQENGILSDLYDESAEAERRVENTVNEILAEYSLNFDGEDHRVIIDRVDIASELKANRERSGDYSDYGSNRGGSGGWASTDAVDDLFESNGPMGGI